jgi:hypothetical protein
VAGCTINKDPVKDTWNLGNVLSTALFSTWTILASDVWVQPISAQLVTLF